MANDEVLAPAAAAGVADLPAADNKSDDAAEDKPGTGLSARLGSDSMASCSSISLIRW